MKVCVSKNVLLIAKICKGVLRWNTLITRGKVRQRPADSQADQRPPQRRRLNGTESLGMMWRDTMILYRRVPPLPLRVDLVF